ncbi:MULTISPECIES: hypothetical protein [unclassified Micromonospora]|uniref:VHL beta domain-containing protein n=1 Tax=unclassified Micromonospora TaxID=2617518 RepID=UPI0022B673AA|nr:MULTISPECIES: hypothetical protein [unclassified Micromonospora]MCZ7421380.1 hypothetical protein [Verrucosispora sp. WMMA2121]WBB93931.1 hypothetical protein O7597_13625 [Verrucosispora sp. WMMC514]
MTQSPDHEQPRVEPRLRVGPWLFDPRSRARQLSARPVPRALPPAPVAGDGRPVTEPPPVREPTVAFEPARRASGRMSHRLMLAGLAAAVLGLLVTTLWPAAEPPTVAAPDVPSDWIPPQPGGPGSSLEGVASADALSPSAPAASSSVGGVSSSRPQLSRRATPVPSATRPASPTVPPRPSARPTPTPSRSAGPPPTTRPPEPAQLTPLPAWREHGLRSVSGGSETSIEFVNLRSRSVIVYWLDHRGHRRQYAVLHPDESYRQHTYVGHPWVVTDRRGRALVCFEPTRTSGRAVIR